MALPAADNGTFAQVTPRGGSKAMRIASIGFAVIMASAAIVALVGQASEAPRQTELVVLSNSGSDDANINALAREFLQHGAQMSPAEAYMKVKSMNADPHLATLMASPARTPARSSKRRSVI